MKYKKWELGKLVENEILCPECRSPNVVFMYSDCNAGGYWSMYECLNCGEEFPDEPGGSEQ